MFLGLETMWSTGSYVIQRPRALACGVQAYATKGPRPLDHIVPYTPCLDLKSLDVEIQSDMHHYVTVSN